MKKQTIVYLAMLGLMAAIAGAEEPGRSAYGRDELFGLGPQRVFEGESLREVAFPLGGIGTGTISLGGRPLRAGHVLLGSAAGPVRILLFGAGGKARVRAAVLAREPPAGLDSLRP